MFGLIGRFRILDNPFLEDTVSSILGQPLRVEFEPADARRSRSHTVGLPRGLGRRLGGWWSWQRGRTGRREGACGAQARPGGESRPACARLRFGRWKKKTAVLGLVFAFQGCALRVLSR